MKEFSVTADIKHVILQISVCEHDRSYLKFLWMDDGDPYKLNLFRHCRVVFQITFIPFLLIATLKIHLKYAPHSFKNTYFHVTRLFLRRLVS